MASTSESSWKWEAALFFCKRFCRGAKGNHMSYGSPLVQVRESGDPEGE